MPPQFPRPRAGHLTIYLGGGAGGVGESIVLCMPDERWVVVDACACSDAPGHTGWNFPLTLLRQLGAQRIGLLAITHPDHDHFSGLQELVEGYSQQIDVAWTFWRRNLREMAHSAHERIKNRATAARLQLFDFLDYALLDDHGVESTTPRFPAGCYPAQPADYRIRVVMPTRHDQQRWQDEMDQHAADLIALGVDPSAQPSSHITRALLSGRQPKLHANMLSLGLVIEWGKIKVFLPGDMEVEAAQPGGWSGMLAELDRRPETLQLLDEANVVKAPHHGSRTEESTALHEPTWTRLIGGRSRVPYVLLTPKNGGGNPPPQHAGLRWLSARAHVMGITAAPRQRAIQGGWGYVTHHQSGWAAMGGAGADGVGAWVMLDISPRGYITRRAGDQSRWLVPQP